MLGRALVIGASACLFLAACGDDESGDAGGGVEVAVNGTDDACTPAQTEVAAGKTTFVFTNSSKSVSEIYVKTSSDKIMKEVENVPTGQIRKVTVTLEAGQSYTLTCKPGQKGDGFSSQITVK